MPVRVPEIIRALVASTEGYSTGLGDNVTEGSIFLSYAKSVKAFRPSSGEMQSFAVRLRANTNVQSFGASTVAKREAQNNSERLYAEPSFVRCTDSISVTDMIKLRGTMGKIFDLHEEKMETIIDDLGEKVNFYAFNDNSTDELAPTGMLTSILDTGTYLGVSRATEAQWQANVEDVSNNFATNGLTALRKISKDVSHSYTRKYPTVYFTDKITHGLYEEENTDKARYVKETSTKGDLGFEALEYKGAPIIWDEDCPATNIFCLRMGEGKKSPFQIFNWLDGFVEPTEQESYVEAFNFGQQCALQFVACEPRGLGKIENTYTP